LRWRLRRIGGRPSPLIGYGDVADDRHPNPMKRRATEIAAAAQLRSIGGRSKRPPM
jgi:hypothetical protein